MRTNLVLDTTRRRGQSADRSDDFQRFFDRAVAGAPELATSSDPWDRIARACEADEPIDGIVSDRLTGGWRVDVFGLSGFLADDAIPDSAAACQSGVTIRVRVLRFDRVGTLRLWIRPGEIDR